MGTKTTWGGARPGAGRKAEGEPRTERITVNVSPSLKRALETLAEAQKTTIGSLVNRILTEAVGRG